VCTPPREVDNPDALLKFWQVFDLDELARAGKVRVAGEATPSYLLGGRAVAERMRAALGSNLRLLIILRDPVKRAYSHYQMTADTNGTKEQLARRGTVAGRSFESLIDEDLAALRTVGADDPDVDLETFEREYLSKTPMGNGSHSYVGRGLYALQIRQWLKVFPREQFLFLKLEDFSRDIQGNMRNVFSFIGLDAIRVPDIAPKNAREYEPISADLEARLKAFYAPHNKRLAELLGPEFAYEY